MSKILVYPKICSYCVHYKGRWAQYPAKCKIDGHVIEKEHTEGCDDKFEVKYHPTSVDEMFVGWTRDFLTFLGKLTPERLQTMTPSLRKEALSYLANTNKRIKELGI